MTTLSLQLLDPAPAGEASPARDPRAAQPGRGSKEGHAAFGAALGRALSADDAAGHAAAAFAHGAQAAGPGARARPAAEVSDERTGPAGERRGRRAEPKEAEPKAAGDAPTAAQTAAAAALAGTPAARRAPARAGDAPQGGTPAAAAGAAGVKAPLASVDAAVGRLAARAAAKGPLAAPGTAAPADPVHAAGKGAAQAAPAREKAREREAPRAEQVATPARAELTAPAPALAEPRAASRAAAPAAAAPAPLPAAPAGQDVQGAVLHSAAHLKVDAGGALGAIELHLRVRDGAVLLRVDGDAARAVESHAGELSRSLAGHGLELAPIEVGARDAGASLGGQGGRGFEERREAWQEAADARQGPTAAPPAPAGRGAPPTRSDRGVHVEA
ncbi:hypothetical protein [Anaeromyxobacter diazotrophicus]|uniref:Flagellar hook-length control protein n=1 Tax=Anaeromyxobacter diazotrophicus TaxID=2590199 RepID=A0A7I9VKS2_9BACT|nr:hypothetical protein [Anaeromyxobacter diazotrophicus]GEJ56991.1 hypothetical protein AMYX_17320 [Anaeromyxobacter diazotrophicus]